MLRSRSCHAAVRSGAKHRLRQPNPLASSNKFINFALQERQHEVDPESLSTASTTQIKTLAVKDNIATTGLPTTCGSQILKSHKSPFEATVVGKLQGEGAFVHGKTNLDEFGMGSHSINSYFGPVFDDSNPRRSVGGSSGGSAIAVAQGLSDFALGTDTGGSVRLPAAYTGIVGFKPSYGLISRWGVVPYANSLDTVGVLAPSTKELASTLNTLRRHDPRDPTSVTDAAWGRILDMNSKSYGGKAAKSNSTSLSELSIGVPVEYNIEELDSAVRDAWSNALSLLRKNGCKIVPVSLPSTTHALSAYYVLAPAEAASNLAKYDGVRYGTRETTRDGSGDVLYSQTRGLGFGDEVKRRILLGSYTLSANAIDNYFLKAQRVRRLVQRDFDRIFQTPNPLRPNDQFDISDLHESISLEDKLGPAQVDFVICPTAPTLPPTLKDAFDQSGVDSYMNDVFTVPASLAGLPAISVPFRISPQFQADGQPDFAGIQIIGQYGSDFRLLQVSRLFEDILRAHQRFGNPPGVDKMQGEQATRTVRSQSEDGVGFATIRKIKIRKPFIPPAERIRARQTTRTVPKQWRDDWAKGFLEPDVNNKAMLEAGATAAIRKYRTKKPTELIVRKFVNSDPIKLTTYSASAKKPRERNLTDKEADSLLSDTLDKWAPGITPDQSTGR